MREKAAAVDGGGYGGRHAQLAKVYPTLYGGGGSDGAASSGGAAAAKEGVDGEGESVGIFKKEFGHLSEAAQTRFREDSLWMGQAELAVGETVI